MIDLGFLDVSRVDTIRGPHINLLERYLNELGWKQSDLAAAARVSTAQVSGWLTGHRVIARSHINRLAWAIADGKRLAGRKPTQRAAGTSLATQNKTQPAEEDFVYVDNLDGILNELLVAAGYSAILGAGQDTAWSRVSKDGVLRIGWVHYPPFCYHRQGAQAALEPAGLAADIMRRVAKLMGVQPVWPEYSWGDIIDVLQRREIDCVLPILAELPSRLFQVRFTSPLPDVYLGLNGVINTSAYNRVVVGKDDQGEEKIKADDLTVAFVEGEVGQDLFTIVVPRPETDRGFNDFKEACAELRKKPIEGEPVQCLVADHMICSNLVAEHKDHLRTLFTRPQRSEIELTIAAAVHMDEPKLLMILNSCLNTLERVGYFKALYHHSDSGKELIRLEVIRDDEARGATRPTQRTKKTGVR